MEQRTSRQSNFELIRIFAMLMIIGHHLVVHGVMHCADKEGAYVIWSNGSTVNQLFSAALKMGGQLGVALFFLITGYFMINSDKIKLTRIYCETLFYGVFVILLFAVPYLCGYRFQELTLKSLLAAPFKAILIPITGGSWWFITAYAFLILLHPLINKVSAKLNKHGFLLLLLIAWVFWYSLGKILSASFYDLQRGIFFYLIGGFIKRFDLIAKTKNKKAGLLSVVVLTLVVYTFVTYLGDLRRTDDAIISKLFAKSTSAVVFTVCSLIDLLRQKLVEPFMLRKAEEIKAKVLPQIIE